ncbi:hypothetical protein UlMin_043037 [Ulmus minor]
MPLFAGCFVPCPSGEKVWAQFRYERIAALCHKCGILGHDHHWCVLEPALVKSKEGLQVWKYGTWIHAEAGITDCFSNVPSIPIHENSIPSGSLDGGERASPENSSSPSGYSSSSSGKTPGPHLSTSHSPRVTSSLARPHPSPRQPSRSQSTATQPATSASPSRRPPLNQLSTPLPVLHFRRNQLLAIPPLSSTENPSQKSPNPFAPLKSRQLPLITSGSPPLTTHLPLFDYTPTISPSVLSSQTIIFSSLSPQNELPKARKKKKLPSPAKHQPNSSRKGTKGKSSFPISPCKLLRFGGAPDAMMNILIWNVRGLGNTRTFQILREHVQQFCPSLVFLSETLCSKSYLEQIRVKLNFSGMVTWEKEGRSGGLCLLWADSVEVRLLTGSKGHIDAIISSHDNLNWRFTGLYGNPDTSLKTQFWDLLKRLGDSHSLSWLCGGDLNEILFEHEKRGGGARDLYLLRNFRDAMEYCNLADLGFRGPKFTWCRGNNNANFIQERLDRMLGNSGWSDMFPNSIVHHLRLWGSDHRPLLIEVLKDGNLDEVANKLHQCASDLLRWNLEKFRWLREEVKKKTIAFNQADRALSSANWKTHQRLERELEALKYKEEKYWQQRLKDMWLKSGDRNSKFFHRKASARRAKNSIVGLFDSNEKWCEDKEGIAHIAESYFTNLFSSSSPLSLDMDMVLNSLETKVSPAMNEQLDGRFDVEDVRTAIFQMAPSKSPGADSMSALFYQKYWPIVGEEVTTACLGFLNEGLDLGSINETLITLLPKVKCPTHMIEFRPISLCNVLYKITSKMLAMRMRSVMDSIISEEQSAFIPGRLISDNAIIGFECLHALKRRRSKKKGFLALKLDMAKAYDRVEWSFIREVMKKLGFSEGWIKKVMDCVTSVYYSLLINGEKVGYIRPSRGLRQGDPLSPYLFLLCAEGLPSLIHTFEITRQLQGMRYGTNGPTISHLFFADDSLLFVEATPTSCYAIKEILLQYETASGQLVNYSKSAVCFGPSISAEDIGRMVAILGFAQVKCHEHYLGLPCFSGKNKSKLFNSIKDRVWNKLCGWKSKLLSAGGREILTKAIIQAIPTYSMNMFKIPISLIKELHRLCARFWWGGDISKQKMHWCTWEQLCVHKKNGGMGFRDLRLFNKAILAKQAWRIHTQPSSLVARVLQGFYFTSSSFLQVKKSNAASFVWRSILWGRELFL